MEKLVYLLWKPDDTADNVWHQQLTQTLIPALRIAGAHRFRLNLADAGVAGADSMRMACQSPLPDALLSFWMNSSHERHPAEKALSAQAKQIAGYSVCESEPLPDALHSAPEGERCYGMNHIVFLQKPPRLSREEWLDIWLESHTAIAIDTQQNFGYRQNIVVRSLTKHAPAYDAIVEENFPPEAIGNQDAFYRYGNLGQLANNQKRMFQSCVRFIDFDKMGRLPSSEFNFK